MANIGGHVPLANPVPKASCLFDIGKARNPGNEVAFKAQPSLKNFLKNIIQLQFICHGICHDICPNGQTVSAVDSSASWVNVSRCEFKSSNIIQRCIPCFKFLGSTSCKKFKECIKFGTKNILIIVYKRLLSIVCLFWCCWIN